MYKRQVYENQMMSGTGDDVFTPDAATTRGMIVTILYRMEGNPATDSDAKFTDGSAGQYYAEAAAWANEKNIVNGYGSGAFGPNEPITREQMAAVLYRYAKLKGYHTAAAGNLVGFSDAGDVSVYAVDPAKWAVGNGLISGVGNNMLAPGASSTRAQIAVILTRFCKNIIPSGPVDPSDSVIYEKMCIRDRYVEEDTGYWSYTSTAYDSLIQSEEKAIVSDNTLFKKTRDFIETYNICQNDTYNFKVTEMCIRDSCHAQSLEEKKDDWIY